MVLVGVRPLRLSSPDTPTEEKTFEETGLPASGLVLVVHGAEVRAAVEL